MFVEKLTREQVRQFIREYLEEADFHPEVSNSSMQIDFGRHWHKHAIEIFYCSKFFNKHKSFYYMDDGMQPIVSRELENAWIQYLYSIFGEEYKEWFMAEKAKLFE